MAFIIVAESCYIHGDPHINTTDGDAYTFAGDVTCDYILAESHRVPKFKIIGSFVECRTSCLNKITFEIRPGRKTYILGPGNVTEAGPTGGDISTITLPYSDGHETVEEEGEQIILMRNASWNSISISWNKHNSAKIEFSADRFYNSGMTGEYCVILPLDMHKHRHESPVHHFQRPSSPG